MKPILPTCQHRRGHLQEETNTDVKRFRQLYSPVSRRYRIVCTCMDAPLNASAVFGHVGQSTVVYTASRCSISTRRGPVLRYEDQVHIVFPGLKPDGV